MNIKNNSGLIAPEYVTHKLINKYNLTETNIIKHTTTYVPLFNHISDFQSPMHYNGFPTLSQFGFYCKWRRWMETILRMTIMILNFWHIDITTNVPINGKITSIPCLISSNGKLQSRQTRGGETREFWR